MLTTGSAWGNVITQEDLYISDAPYLYVQDRLAGPVYNPDAEGYYWFVSGTSTYPVYNVGCVLDVSLTEGVTMNDVRCDTVGIKDTIQRRDYIELNLTISSLFPLSVASILMNLSSPTASTDEESVGIGRINNNKHYQVYMPKVYDNDAGDYIVIHLHKAKFVDAWTINMAAAEPWTLTGLKIRAFADETKPDSMLFGVLKRFDSSALPTVP